MTRAILYTRVSTSAQEEKGTSLESQLEALRKHAKASGYDVLEHISDTHSGADLWNRPGISKARERVRQRHIDVLLAYSIDRLSRDPSHLVILLDECERYGARLEFVTEQVEDSADWKLIQYIRGYTGAIEREKIRERNMRGKRQKLLRGELMQAGLTLYGYRHIKAEGRREICEAEAEIVRRIYRDVIAGKSLRSIVTALNAEGVPSPSSGKRRYKDGHTPLWGPSQLKTIINEPSYYGHLTVGRWQSTGQGRIIKKPDGEHIRLSGSLSPAIVSQDTFDHAQGALSQNRGTLTRNEKRPCLLRGLVRCRRCGCIMRPQPYSYVCNSNNRIKARFCGAKAVRRRTLEAWAWTAVLELYTDPENVAARILEMEKIGRIDKSATMRELAAKQKRIAEFETQQARLLRMAAASGEAKVEKLAVEQVKALAAQSRELEAEIARIRAKQSDADDLEVRIKMLIKNRSSIQLPATTLERHKMLEDYGFQILADHEENWSITVRLPPSETARSVQKTSVFSTERDVIEIARHAA